MPSKKAQQTILNIFKNKPEVKQTNKQVAKKQKEEECNCSRCKPRTFEEYASDLQAETFLYLYGNKFSEEEVAGVVMELLSCAARWHTYIDGSKKEITAVCGDIIADFLKHKKEIVEEVQKVQKEFEQEDAEKKNS